MRYRAILAPGAEDDINGFADEWMPCIARQLSALLDNPVTLSRPSFVPFEAAFQIHSFDCEFDDGVHVFRVMFRYGADEMTLHIYAIGHVHYWRQSDD